MNADVTKQNSELSWNSGMLSQNLIILEMCFYLFILEIKRQMLRCINTHITCGYAVWESVYDGCCHSYFQNLTPPALLLPCTVRCTEVPDTGSCRDGITKWYYNPVKQECSPFNYGGCKGNENRFDTPQSCMKVCRGVTGVLLSMSFYLSCYI